MNNSSTPPSKSAIVTIIVSQLVAIGVAGTLGFFAVAETLREAEGVERPGFLWIQAGIVLLLVGWFVVSLLMALAKSCREAWKLWMSDGEVCETL